MANVEYSGEGRDVVSYFTGKTAAYEQFRPDYPEEAITFVLRTCPTEPMVADIGCGTGISTRGIARQGACVLGVEPNDEMRSAAVRRDVGDSRIAYRPGTAESTGLASASVNAVICAQSFHWFDVEAALKEFHRITRPGGILGLLWNVRDESASAASAAYERIIRRAQDIARQRGRVVGRHRSGDATRGGFFRVTEQKDFNNPISYTLEELLGRAHSASYFPEHGAVADELDELLRRLFREHEADGRVTLAQRCHVTLCTRVDEPT